MKHTIKKILTHMMLVTMVISGITVLTPSDTPLITEVSAASIKMNAKTKTIYKGKSTTLKITGTKKKVTWSSSNKKIATVSSKGKVTAKKAGTCTITAKVAGKKYTCKVTVKNPTLSKKSVSLNKGKTTTLKVTGGSSIKWSTSNKKVATVNSKGKITAIGKGTATITAKTSGVTLKCTVKVMIPVSSVKLSKTSLSLNKGSSSTLTATVSPSNANTKTVTWSSSNTKVAKVSGGKVTAVSAGTATITAKSHNGKTATCKVTVKDSTSTIIPVSSLSLDKTALTKEVGYWTTLDVTVSPSNATNQTITWSSSNPNVVSVDNNGKIMPKAAGKATITAMSNNGKTATCVVTVNETPQCEVSLNKTSETLKLNQTLTLTPTIKSNTTIKSKEWYSNNSGVATVDNNGKVTAVDEGTTTIWFSVQYDHGTYDENVAVGCKITVEDKVVSITLDEQSVTMYVDDVYDLSQNVTIKKESGEKKLLTYSQVISSDTSIIDGHDQLTANKPGTAKITILEDGISQTFHVTVKDFKQQYQYKNFEILNTNTIYSGYSAYVYCETNKSPYQASDRTLIFKAENGTTLSRSDTAYHTSSLSTEALDLHIMKDNYGNRLNTNSFEYALSSFIDIGSTDTYGICSRVPMPHTGKVTVDIYESVVPSSKYIIGNKSYITEENSGINTGKYYIEKYARVKVGSITVTDIKDCDISYKEWQDSIIDKFYQPDKDPVAVLRSIESYLKENSKYAVTDGQTYGPWNSMLKLELVSHSGPTFETMEYGCEDAASTMQDLCYRVNERYKEDGIDHHITAKTAYIDNGIGGYHMICYLYINGEKPKINGRTLEYLDFNQSPYGNLLKNLKFEYIK